MAILVPMAGLQSDLNGLAANENSQVSHSHWSLRAFMNSRPYESFSALVTCLNAAIIGVQSQHGIASARANIGAGRLPLPDFFGISTKAFALFYFSELLAKVVAFRGDFVCGEDFRWNLFDAGLVVSALYEMVTEAIGGGEGGGSVLLVLRLLKLFKLLRLVRVMRFFDELRTMLLVITGSVTTLFWTAVMLGLIMYIFGLCFLQAVTVSLSHGNLDPETETLMLDHWGSLGGAMITLFEAVSGGNDWSTLAQPLWAAGTFYYVLFLFYILFLIVAVLNVLTGMFVDAAVAVSTDNKEESDALKAHDLRRQEGHLEKVTMLFDSVENTKSGYMSWSVFKNQTQNQDVMNFLEQYDITLFEAEHFFNMCLFLEENNEARKDMVHMHEFLNGITQIKGPSKGVDVACLMYDLRLLARDIQQALSDIQVSVDGCGRTCGSSSDSTCNLGVSTGSPPAACAPMSSPLQAAADVGDPLLASLRACLADALARDRAASRAELQRFTAELPGSVASAVARTLVEEPGLSAVWQQLPSISTQPLVLEACTGPHTSLPTDIGFARSRSPSPEERHKFLPTRQDGAFGATVGQGARAGGQRGECNNLSMQL